MISTSKSCVAAGFPTPRLKVCLAMATPRLRICLGQRSGGITDWGGIGLTYNRLGGGLGKNIEF